MDLAVYGRHPRLHQRLLVLHVVRLDLRHRCSYLEVSAAQQQARYYRCHQHFLGHHPFTNVAEADPDVHTNDPVDFRRIKAEQPWYSHYRLQHLYAPVLYGTQHLLVSIQSSRVALDSRCAFKVCSLPSSASTTFRSCSSSVRMARSGTFTNNGYTYGLDDGHYTSTIRCCAIERMLSTLPPLPGSGFGWRSF